MKRILILGDKTTGKTTFLNIFLNKQINLNEDSTLGVQAAAKTIQFDNHSYVNLQIWDTPGQQEYLEMAYPFYSNCKIFILILDRSNKQTLNSFPNWLQRIQQNNTNKISRVLVILNKIPRKYVSNKKVQQFTQGTLQQEYRKQLNMAQKNNFKITIMQIDLIGQKDQLNIQYINPYLQQNLPQQIITQKQQNKQSTCGKLNCQSNGCYIM